MSGNTRMGNLEVDERRSALLSNAGAIAVVAGAIEGTLGPKGLNCMLVDRFGEAIISNDGRAILERMEISHPAARLLIQTAKAQDREVGDGTTTTCLLAQALISEGVNQILAGVPVARIVEGMRAGLARAMELLQNLSRPIKGFEDPLLRQAALIAAREQEDIADLVLAGARIAGKEKLAERGFRLADWIIAREGEENEVISGLALAREPLNRQMPRALGAARILLIDDALEPEALEEEALATESGFKRYREIQENFKADLTRLIEAKVNLVMAGRGVSEIAEQTLTEAGVLVLRRVSARELAAVAEHTGAKPVKRSGLGREGKAWEKILGRAQQAFFDEKLSQLRILGGKGKPSAAILLGAGTAEVREERRRIAEDAACVVQQALLGGIVPGGGAAEMSLLQEMEQLRAATGGLAAFGVDCVIAALRRPLAQIVINAGYNPLEKVEQVNAAFAAGKSNIGINCDTGEICDMLNIGVVDASRVKLHALKCAGEVAEAVLRINTVIRKKEENRPSPSSDTGG
jgi:archaeal chaperonin